MSVNNRITNLRARWELKGPFIEVLITRGKCCIASFHRYLTSTHRVIFNLKNRHFRCYCIQSHYFHDEFEFTEQNVKAFRAMPLEFKLMKLMGWNTTKFLVCLMSFFFLPQVSFITIMPEIQQCKSTVAKCHNTARDEALVLPHPPHPQYFLYFRFN